MIGSSATGGLGCIMIELSLKRCGCSVENCEVLMSYFRFKFLKSLSAIENCGGLVLKLNHEMMMSCFKSPTCVQITR